MSIDTYLGIAGVALGFAGLITGYILYRKSLRIKQPYYYVITNNLVQDGIATLEKLDIIYSGKRISSLTVSKVIFWNNGSETINDSDIVKANPLRVECGPSSHILDATIIESNNKSSKFSLEFSSDDKRVFVHFDYIDKYQGVLIQVVHAGSLPNDIRMLGDFRGASLAPFTIERIRVTSYVLLIVSTLFVVSVITVYSMVLTSIHLTPLWDVIAILPVSVAVAVIAYPTTAWINKVSNPFPIELEIYKSSKTIIDVKALSPSNLNE